MKKLNKEQLEAVIDSFREYLNNGDVIFRDALKEKGLIEEEFEAGKWYKHCSGGFWFIQKSIENGQHIVYGFDADMEWIEEWEVFLNSSVLTKATDSEVSTALITEAKKRGFKEGVRVEGYNYVVSGDFFYQKNHKSLYMGKEGGSNISIFTRGCWKSIEEEEEKEFLIQVQKGTIIIEGKEYTAEEIINKFNK